MSSQFLRRGIALFAVYALSLIAASEAWSFSARLTWLPVADSAGYRLYLRENGGAYDAPIDLGAIAPDSDGKVRAVVDQLDETAANGFSVSSYDATHTSESPRSNEITLAYATVASVLDSDHDGLLDALEDRNLDTIVEPGETDRRRADTDGDGIVDGLEVAHGTNPLDPNDPPVPTAVVTTTPTPRPTATRTATATPLPTATRTATTTPVPTATRTATATPVPTVTRTPSATTTAVPTPTRTVTPSLTATAVATSAPTVTAVEDTPTVTSTPTVTAEDTPTVTSTPTATSTPLPTPNGECAAPFPVPQDGGVFTGNTSSTRAGSVNGSCAPTNRASERVFAWTPSQSGVATLQALPAPGTRFDTALYVRSGSCSDGPELACNDNRYGRRWTGRSSGSYLHLNVTAGETYFVVVDGVFGSTGRFTLTIDPPDAPATTVGDEVDPGTIDPADGDPTADEHPVAYRCQRVTDSSGDSSSDPPLEIHTVDRFGETSAVVQDALRLCLPIDTIPPTADEAPVIRFDVTVRDYVPAPLGDEVHVSNELGEMIIDVLEPASVQTAAVVDTAPPASPAPAAAGAIATCYKVRASDGSPDTWTLDVTLQDPPEELTVSGPTRLCTTGEPVDDDASAEVQLCYRMRTIVPDSAAVWVTSVRGSEFVDLGAADEICLPSTIVSDPSD